MSDKDQKFLLEDAIQELVNPEKSLSGPLMKLLYFGKLTDNETLINFTEKELNGFEVNDELPEYRKIGARLEIDILSAGQVFSKTDFPLSSLSEEMREACTSIPLLEGISSLERTKSDLIVKGNDMIEFPLPSELLLEFQPTVEKIYNSSSPYRSKITAARLTTRSARIEDLLQKVRTNLLAFAMDIAKEFGHEVDISEYRGDKTNNNQKVNTYMITNNITGDGNILNTGDKAKIKASVTISKGNKEELASFLEEFGVDAKDSAALMEIIDQEEPNRETKSFGSKVSSWIGQMVAKAASGGWQVSAGAAGQLLAEAITKYYGL
ncbi:hypothetical protein GTQ34_12145 [Muricauda sp. JGD-17]|uniref:AbiTii domain-containing protein n=1 Tax=Flagellimonas ochracea TaxID=2696472 RepID=A0A964TEE7_9FLAO|nr:hypothetical protein [Allomuricauda ochracea]NAY92669.1 hypothetical protein [Allomuricauda ochracea]